MSYRDFGRKHEPKHMFGLDENGNLVWASDAEHGKLYKCPFCNTASLTVYQLKSGKFLRTKSGTAHTGRKCATIDRGKGRVNVSAIDINQIYRNAIRIKSNIKQQDYDYNNPVKPRSLPENIVMFSSLSEIRRYRLNLMDDFPVDELTSLVDHFVSERNAYMVMDANKSFEIRALEVDVDYALQWSKTIRFTLKAHKNQNGLPTAARKVIDLVCADYEMFFTARNRLFYLYKDVNGRVRPYPRYKRALVVGRFNAVPASECEAHQGCTKACRMEFTHCTGRQCSKLENMAQIFVDELDRIEFPQNLGIQIQ